MEDTCPLRKKNGEFICIDGILWALSYSEMAPPDQRQSWGPCEYCARMRKTGGANPTG